MVLGGVPAAQLAQIYGTPLLVLDVDVLDAALDRFAGLSKRFGIDVAYAGKALLFTALAERVAAAGLGLDVCSLGELLVAERAKFPAARLTLHGCGKTHEELRAAVEGRVGRIVVDHRDELEALAALSRPDRRLDVLLRINPGIEADTHRYVRTAGADSKFGFVEGEVGAAVARTLAVPGLRLAGLHAHIGSNVFAIEPYLAALDVILGVYGAAYGAGAPLGDLVMGGGFGVAAEPGGARFDAEALVAALTARLGDPAHSFSAPRLGIEPGRAIVAEAGTSLYRIVTVKRHGERRFVIVDGGLADNPRPALYGADHAPVAVGRRFADDAGDALVCGRSCESDELGSALLPVDVRAGDLLALRMTGAYTFSMSSNYNRFPRPAVIFAGSGRHHAVVRREPHDMLLAFESAAAR